MLKDLPIEQQNRVVAKIWTNIGIDPGDVTSDLLKDWREELADLSSDEVEAGIHFWKVKGCTCPADEFAASCKPQPSKKTTPEDMGLTPQLDLGESDMTYLQAYNHICRSRWGEIDPNHPEMQK